MLTSGKKKRAQRLTFGPGDRRWGGGLPREGVVAEKVRALPRKFFFLGFRRQESGMSRNFAGMSRTLGVFKKFVQKSSFAFFVPYHLEC